MSEVVFSPETITITDPEGSKTVIDMEKQPVINYTPKHEHEFVSEGPDSYTPHLTSVVCKVCGLGRILKTGDIFSEKDILNLDGTIEPRKSPLTAKEKTLTKSYQKKVKEKWSPN